MRKTAEHAVKLGPAGVMGTIAVLGILGLGYLIRLGAVQPVTGCTGPNVAGRTRTAARGLWGALRAILAAARLRVRA